MLLLNLLDFDLGRKNEQLLVTKKENEKTACFEKIYTMQIIQ